MEELANNIYMAAVLIAKDTPGPERQEYLDDAGGWSRAKYAWKNYC